MPHILWVTRQNKLEIPIDKDEVNKREIRECDGREHDPDTMVAPLTPKPTRKAELTRYRYVRCILETKTKVGRTEAKDPDPRTNPNINEAPTTPKSHTHPSHECDATQRRWPPHRHPSTRKAEDLSRAPPTIASRREEDVAPHVPTQITIRRPPHLNHPPTHPTCKPPTINPVFIPRCYILFHFVVLHSTTSIQFS